MKINSPDRIKEIIKVAMDSQFVRSFSIEPGFTKCGFKLDFSFRRLHQKPIIWTFDISWRKIFDGVLSLGVISAIYLDYKQTLELMPRVFSDNHFRTFAMETLHGCDAKFNVVIALMIIFMII